MGERQHDDGHADVENDWPCIDYTAGERSHVFDCGEIAQQVARCGAHIEKDELNQAEKKQQRNRTEGNDRSNDLVPRENRRETTNREIKHSQQQEHEIGTSVCSCRMCSRLVRDREKDSKIKQRRDPKNYVEHQRAKKFRQYYLPVSHRSSGQRLNRAELKFLGEETHRDQRENQNKGKPEEDRVKKRLLDRVLHLALVHEGDLKIKIDPADDQEKDKHDVGDRRMEVAAYFAREQGVKFTHTPSLRS